jgi:hypothetical protein
VFPMHNPKFKILECDNIDARHHFIRDQQQKKGTFA